MEQLAVTRLYDELVDSGLFTYEELQLITNMCGYSIETLNKALYVRYGYRDLEQMKGENNDR